jgi:hypothetical protein
MTEGPDDCPAVAKMTGGSGEATSGRSVVVVDHLRQAMAWPSSWLRQHRLDTDQRSVTRGASRIGGQQKRSKVSDSVADRAPMTLLTPPSSRRAARGLSPHGRRGERSR